MTVISIPMSSPQNIKIGAWVVKTNNQTRVIIPNVNYHFRYISYLLKLNI